MRSGLRLKGLMMRPWTITCLAEGRWREHILFCDSRCQGWIPKKIVQISSLDESDILHQSPKHCEVQSHPILESSTVLERIVTEDVLKKGHGIFGVLKSRPFEGPIGSTYLDLDHSVHSYPNRFMFFFFFLPFQYFSDYSTTICFIPSPFLSLWDRHLKAFLVKHFGWLRPADGGSSRGLDSHFLWWGQ